MRFMGIADDKRNQREAEIAKAVRGPDYTMRDTDVAKVKAEAGRKAESRSEYMERVRFAMRKRALEHSVFIPQGPDRSQDQGQGR